MNYKPSDDSDTKPGIGRRHILRAMTWAAVASVSVLTLAACGGEGDDEEGNEEDDD